MKIINYKHKSKIFIIRCFCGRKIEHFDDDANPYVCCPKCHKIKNIKDIDDSCLEDILD